MRPDENRRVEREYAIKCAKEGQNSAQMPAVDLSTEDPPLSWGKRRAPQDAGNSRRRKRSRTEDEAASSSVLRFDGPAAVPLVRKRSAPDSAGPSRTKRQRTEETFLSPSTGSSSPGLLTPPPPLLWAPPPHIVSPPQAAAFPTSHYYQQFPDAAQACAAGPSASRYPSQYYQPSPTVPYTPAPSCGPRNGAYNYEYQHCRQGYAWQKNGWDSRYYQVHFGFSSNVLMLISVDRLIRRRTLPSLRPTFRQKISHRFPPCNTSSSRIRRTRPCPFATLPLALLLLPFRLQSNPNTPCS